MFIFIAELSQQNRMIFSENSFMKEDQIWIKDNSDNIFELLYEEFSNKFPVYSSEVSFYIHADYSGLSLSLDYYQDLVPEEEIDKMNDFLFYNTKVIYKKELLKRNFRSYKYGYV